MSSLPNPRHFLCRMNGSDPAIGGDTASWFRFYKWEVEGEVFVPRRSGQHLPVSVGDFLWFSLDGAVLGFVEVLRVVIDPMGSGVQEVWYEPSRAWLAEEVLAQPIDLLTEEVSVETVDRWRRSCAKRLVDVGGPVLTSTAI